MQEEIAFPEGKAIFIPFTGLNPAACSVFRRKPGQDTP